jgi:hypothetical protein
VRLEDDDVLDHGPRPDQSRMTAVAAAVGHELRHRVSRVGDHDLFTLAHSTEQMREQIARVSRVVLGEVAWAGVATWRGVASPPEKSLQHGTIVRARWSRGCVTSMPIS